MTRAPARGNLIHALRCPVAPPPYHDRVVASQSPFTPLPGPTVFAQNDAAAPCQDGNWLGWLYTTVTFYSGYVGSSSGFGSEVPITC